MRACLVTLVFLLAVTTAHSQQPPLQIDVTKLGPQVGDRIADFRLTDQVGKVWTRDAVMGPKGLMLVLSRSADWCPYCKTQLVELQSRLPELKKKGMGLAVMTYDSTAILADFSRAAGHHVSPSVRPGFGHDQGVWPAEYHRRSDVDQLRHSVPGNLYRESAGRCHRALFRRGLSGAQYRGRHLLKLGDPSHEIDAQRLTTDLLELTTYVSDQVVAPGTLFSIVADVTPRPGTHVYAPGGHDYKVVALRLNPQPYLRARAAAVPQSRRSTSSSR